MGKEPKRDQVTFHKELSRSAGAIIASKQKDGTYLPAFIVVMNTKYLGSFSRKEVAAKELIKGHL